MKYIPKSVDNGYYNVNVLTLFIYTIIALKLRPFEKLTLDATFRGWLEMHVFRQTKYFKLRNLSSNVVWMLLSSTSTTSV